MKIIDVSWPLVMQMTGYKDKIELKVTKTRSFGESGVRESRISIGVHAGTHVDAASHMLKTGKPVEHINLDKLIGDAVLLDLTSLDYKITKSDLENYDLKKDMILLFKTKNSQLSATQKFNKDFIYLDAQAAQYCADVGVKAVGIDYLGIERDQHLHETHKILFSNNIAIIEGLRFLDVQPGKYFFICLPLKLENVDASPARAVLISDK